MRFQQFTIRPHPATLRSGLAVIRVSEFQLYQLAIQIHPLTELKDELTYNDVWYEWFDARSALNEIFKQRVLEFSRQAAIKLHNAITAIVPEDFVEAVDKISEQVSGNDIGLGLIAQIRDAAKEFETILHTELDNADTYFILPKGTHKTSVLMFEAHRELPSYVTKDIPEVVEDFNEAGKCMLLNSGTASAFHLLRATETVIRKYLEILTGKSVAAKTRNWGAYIKLLNDCGARPQITGILQHIKETYRNPILHPEVLLKPDDAPVLFGLCVSAIIVMANEIKNLSAKGMPLTFPAVGATKVGP